MAKHKAVTISVTHAEFDAIYHAFNEYNTTLERSDSEEYNKFANKQLDNFESFQKKYWRAVHTQQRRDVIKKALTHANSRE
ncbi:hypothetical protein FPQ14_00595 [Gilliamella apicola]|uniref:Uncharacterized protein n=1 Tax=Gilliamella apicola TaxID=1196095 RepID=A0A556RSE5_9GAMM|nr:hypothetical protein [Gilliamella apicola]TSJ91799.1 hypothetical protein FPQ14_00595 [Gilliamella apicola]